MNTQNVWGSQTVQGLIVMVLIQVAQHFGLKIPDQAVNDAAVMLLQGAAALWAFHGHATAAGSPAKPLMLGNVIFQVIADVEKVASEIQDAPAPAPAMNAGQNG